MSDIKRATLAERIDVLDGKKDGKYLNRDLGQLSLCDCDNINAISNLMKLSAGKNYHGASPDSSTTVKELNSFCGPWRKKLNILTSAAEIMSRKDQHRQTVLDMIHKLLSPMMSSAISDYSLRYLFDTTSGVKLGEWIEKSDKFSPSQKALAQMVYPLGVQNPTAELAGIPKKFKYKEFESAVKPYFDAAMFNDVNSYSPCLP